MPPLDAEMARAGRTLPVKNGAHTRTQRRCVAGFRQAADGSLEVLTESGKAHPADLVILAIGVCARRPRWRKRRPRIGKRGGIRVDEHMRTSDPDILAVGTRSK